ncbi:MAG: DUF3253 domain-containing protein [Tahibacter sp.]
MSAAPHRPFNPFRHRCDDPLAERTRSCLLDLLRQESPQTCPSDVARALSAHIDLEWRDLMRLVRTVAAELAREGLLEIHQNGAQVDINDARGPVTLQLKRLRETASAN